MLGSALILSSLLACLGNCAVLCEKHLESPYLGSPLAALRSETFARRQDSRPLGIPDDADRGSGMGSQPVPSAMERALLDSVRTAGDPTDSGRGTSLHVQLRELGA